MIYGYRQETGIQDIEFLALGLECNELGLNLELGPREWKALGWIGGKDMMDMTGVDIDGMGEFWAYTSCI